MEELIKGKACPERRSGEEVPLLVGSGKNLLSTKKHYEHSTTETATIQETDLPSLNKGNGGALVCGTCLTPLAYTYNRPRIRRQTSEKGPTVELLSVTVSRCPPEGRYRTTYPDEMIRYKHYRLEEIQTVLDGKHDYSLACERTKCYWRSWYKEMLGTVVNCLWQAAGGMISKQKITFELKSYLKELGNHWLRYVLDLFSTAFHNLCMFFDLLDATIRPQYGKLHTLHSQWGVQLVGWGNKPPPGG